MTLGREEAIANSQPDEQKPNTKAYQADKPAKGSEVPKGNRNLDAQIKQVNGERCMAYPVRPRQSARIVTTNAEEFVEVEVAVLELDKAKYQIIRNDKQECMFRSLC